MFLVATPARARRTSTPSTTPSAPEQGRLSPFKLETTGGHGASAASVYLLLTKEMRDSGLPADVLLGKLKKDISFALRRGTIAQVTCHALDAGQRAAEEELLPALNRRATGRRVGIAKQSLY
jgi:hypothetical protein